MPVFRRDLCAFYRTGFSDPGAVAADLRELRLQLGSFRLKKLIDIPAHREQLDYGKVFYIGRWHYALQMKIGVSFIKPFGTQLQHPEVE
jgi:hypothetical protein